MTTIINCKIIDQTNVTEGEQVIKPEYISYINVVTLPQSEIDSRKNNNTPINDTDIYMAFEFSGDLQVLTMNSTLR